MKKTAVLIDGGYFIRRIDYFLRKHFPDHELDSQQLVKIIWRIVRFHVEVPHGGHPEREALELYRIYYYDCPPLDKQIKYPLPTDGNKTPATKNFKTHAPNILRTKLHEELRKTRKTALRMGVLSNVGNWQIKEHILKKLLRNEVQWSDLTNDDFYYEYKQKAVDIKLGMDITILAHEKLVDVIVLIAGDADFVPAAKHARIKGVDFILDPMHQQVPASLAEHVDGVQSSNIIVAIADICRIVPSVKPDWWDEHIDRRKERKLNGGKRIKPTKRHIQRSASTSENPQE
ncbi:MULTISPECIES: NYN domain-containing protein [Edwardsiella]|nr:MULTISPECIES: NYN domain-containing protein [Edwardsiella]KAB0587623.1 NYN domain-containing protein [Edwardsiella anguillarum]MDA6077477.1 NYN domain-containing protein [Edwardsiella anguillarum]UBU94571.1 NYN domain-containing protein [Edwardsiella sp. LADL05-105]WHP82382.1 NYN domain-containing protein [Edwardsiella anguillarum]WHP86180.1 NYN domain-containing protein [Edwardsiella anguillarum]